MNQKSQNTLETISAFAVLISTFIVWIGWGYLSWQWVSVDSFFDGVIFVIAWGIIGGLAQSFIAPLISLSIIYFCSLFIADKLTEPKQIYSPPPKINALPQPSTNKTQDSDFGYWLIIGAVICFVIALFTGHQSDNKNQIKAYANQTTSYRGVEPSAECYDGTLSYSLNNQGTCSHHGGVKYWLNSQSIESPTLANPVTMPMPIANPVQLPPPTVSTQPIETSATDNATLMQVKNEFDNWIVNINQAWKQLDPNFRKSILEEQRAFNKARETDCQQYTLTIQGSEIQQETANLTCQIERLKERTHYLQTQVNKTATPPQHASIANFLVTAEQIPLNNTELKEAKIAYHNVIVELNEVWRQLPPSTRENIRPEQRAINKEREYNCKNQALSSHSDPNQQETARLSCEIPLIEERTDYLKTLLPIQIRG